MGKNSPIFISPEKVGKIRIENRVFCFVSGSFKRKISYLEKKKKRIYYLFLVLSPEQLAIRPSSRSNNDLKIVQLFVALSTIAKYINYEKLQNGVASEVSRVVVTKMI